MEDLRSRISSAAQELFLRDGPEGLSMRKIADRVGVTAPAIYRHFRDKDDLLSEIVVTGLRIFEQYLERAIEAPTPYERLHRLLDAYLDFALEQPRYFDFAFLVPVRDVGRLPTEIARQDWKTFRFAIEQVSHCMDEGVFRREEPLEVVTMLWGQAHGLVTLFKTSRLGNDEEVFRIVYRRSVDRLLRGLKP
jgi:AcrR family transcriptional regulator